jgi:hypothetical protein
MRLYRWWATIPRATARFSSLNFGSWLRAFPKPSMVSGTITMLELAGEPYPPPEPLQPSQIRSQVGSVLMLRARHQ